MLYTTEAGGIELVALLGDTPPVVSRGYGKFQISDRPHREGLNEYIGRDPFLFTLPLLFDGYRHRASVERIIHTLERLAAPIKPHDGSPERPPVLHVRGSVPLVATRYRWLVEDIQWADYIRRRAGHGSTPSPRTRQVVTVALGEYTGTGADLAISRARHHRDADRAVALTSRGQVYVVKRGDTLQKIAARHYRDQGKWHEIAKANHLRDGKHLKVGSRLRLP